VDWSALTHAYGAADDVPALLAAVRGPDEVARAEAWWWLRATCCHQGTRYPASVALVEALAAHVADVSLPDRAAALDLLADLAAGDADRALLGHPHPQDGEPDAVATRRAVRALTLPHHDPDPSVRARAARVALAAGASVPPADDPDPVVRAARVLAGAPAPTGDPEPAVRAAIAVVTGDVELAAAIVRALPPPVPLPWLGGDLVRLSIPTLAAAGPDPAARDALSAVAAAGSRAQALDAVLPALRAALDRLPPPGGWSATSPTPPALAACARLVAEARPWLGTPEVWAALPRLGLPGAPAELRRHLGLPHPPSVLDRRHAGTTLRDLGRQLGRSGAGGPTIRRVVGDGVATLSLGQKGHVPSTRASAARALGALGGGAVAVLLALAEEEEQPLVTLVSAMDRAAAHDPAGVSAAVRALAPARVTPVVSWDARGEVSVPGGQVVLLGLATRAATAAGEPSDPSLAPLAEGCLAQEAFHAELLAWLDGLPAEARAAWAADALRRRPGDVTGRLLVRALEVLPDDAVAGCLAHLDPGLALDALPPRRAASLARPLVARTDVFLAERARWMRANVGQEHARLARSLAAKGPAAARAWRAVGSEGPSRHVLPAEAPVAPNRRPREAPAPGDPQAGQEVAKAVVDLVLEEPLLGWLLGRVERELTDATPTMGLRLGPGPRIGLVVNPRWFLGLSSRRVRVGALRHEVLHLLFGHPFRTELANVDLDAFGTAADLVVNEHPSRWPLPGDARRMPFGTPPLPDGGTLDAWYVALLDRRFSAGLELGGTWHSDHRLWRAPIDGRRLSAGDVADAGAAVDALVAEGVTALGGDALWGLDPGLQAAVLGAIERHRSALDWRRVLRAFAASSRRTSLHHTLKRRSRRYGTFPGLRVRRHHRLAVAVDTSGSIAPDVLRLFFGEVAALHRAGSEVVVIECDAAVQRAYPYGGTPPEEVHGRGGTSFEPVMAWLHGPEVGRFDGLVYLTDGEGPPPDTRPPCGVLWVVTPDGTLGDHLRFGRAVKIPAPL
jgi:hypothetical protein